MPSVEDDEWEYEYDEHATETFLLDVDLTSLNSGLRSNIPGKRPLERPEQTGKGNANDAAIQSYPSPIEADVAVTPAESDFALNPAANSMQFLDFHSHNPVISYQNEIYSCTWSDMVGTNVFFAPPTSQPSSQEVPVEFLGTSRIRLIGHRAKAVKKDMSLKKAGRGSYSRGKVKASASGVVVNNPAWKRQSEFLARLEAVKRAKRKENMQETVIPERIEPECQVANEP